MDGKMNGLNVWTEMNEIFQNRIDYVLIKLNHTCYGVFGPYKLGKDPVGLRFCNKNWYIYSLLCYKYTEKI